MGHDEPRESLLIPSLRLLIEGGITPISASILNCLWPEHVFASSLHGTCHWSEDQADLIRNIAWYLKRWNIRIWTNLWNRVKGLRDYHSIITTQGSELEHKTKPCLWRLFSKPLPISLMLKVGERTDKDLSWVINIREDCWSLRVTQAVS